MREPERGTRVPARALLTRLGTRNAAPFSACDGVGRTLRLPQRIQ